MPITWPSLIIEFTTPPSQEEWEIFSARAEYEIGTLGIEDMTAHPKEPPRAVPLAARAFLPATEDEAASGDTLAALAELLRECCCSAVFNTHTEFLADQDWGREWRKYFRPLLITPSLVVAPSWDPSLPVGANADAHVVLIDPGQAFGTGSHETTQLCLRVLEKAMRPATCLLDIGTGSGILGISAIKAGAEFCIGTENDAVCEENFYLNADINGCRDRMLFVLTGLPQEAITMANAQGAPAATMIACNMLSEQFLPHLAALRAPGLPMVLSGFLTTEREEIHRRVTAAGFKITQEDALGDWGALISI